MVTAAGEGVGDGGRLLTPLPPCGPPAADPTPGTPAVPAATDSAFVPAAVWAYPGPCLPTSAGECGSGGGGEESGTLLGPSDADATAVAETPAPAATAAMAASPVAPARGCTPAAGPIIWW